MTAPAAVGSDAADAVCTSYAAGSAVTAPIELKSVNGVLEVTLQFLSAVDAQGLTRYCFVTPAGAESPTLRVNPGDQLIIHFQNMLPTTPAGAAKDNMAGMNMTLAPNLSPTKADNTITSTSAQCNGAMTATASNIHFHGLNVAPVCGQDEVVHTLVQPGQSFDYTVQIPANEPPGLYWYHPHPHGYSEGQVQGGATGALIVEGLQNVDTVLAGLTERTFVVRDQLLPNSEQNDSNIPAWDISLNFVPVLYPAYTPAIIPTNPGRQELWRVANTAADTILDLEYIVNGTPQPMQVVAIDGYPIAAGSSGQLSVNQTDIVMGPGSRAEFVVTTPNVGDSAQLTTLYFNTGPDGDSDPTRVLANVVSSAGAESATATVTHLPSKAKLAKVTRFAALASATPVAQRILNFSEVLQDPTNPNSPTNFYITEQGHTPELFTMDQPPNIVVHAGTVEDWVVQNTALEEHIFHIHQIHFQVLEINGVAVNDPAVRDTIDLPHWNGTGAYPSVKLRMDFRDPNIVGTFVYHCHILQHEDAGMMAEIQVLPSAGTGSATTVTASASSITPNASVTLTANVIDATTGNPTPTGTVQFQINGAIVGTPAAIVNGVATLTAAINGNVGANTITAFYQGDSNYAESISGTVPITISEFALASTGTTAPIGSAALANVTVNAASNFTSLINLTCTLPSNMTESACFVNPTSITGTGKVQLTVNTTPAHPQSSELRRTPAWLVAGGGTSLSCVLLLCFPRRRSRARLMIILGFAAVLFTAMGCGSSTKTDPGTAAGSYTVVVTGTASGGAGGASTQVSVNVPITVQ